MPPSPDAAQTPDDTALIQAALDARARSYAPYSGFAVGAALRDTDGRIWTGVNVENASYGLTVCAERIAVFTAVAQGVRRFVAVAVAGGPAGTDPSAFATPCGACRQVLWEFGPGMTVHLHAAGRTESLALAALLPRAFGPEDLSQPPA